MWPRPPKHLLPEWGPPLDPSQAEEIQDHLPLVWEESPAVRLLWHRVKARYREALEHLLGSEASTESLRHWQGRLAALHDVLSLPHDLLDEASQVLTTTPSELSSRDELHD
jgi:hypothetical protein